MTKRCLLTAPEATELRRLFTLYAENHPKRIAQRFGISTTTVRRYARFAHIDQYAKATGKPPRA